MRTFKTIVLRVAVSGGLLVLALMPQRPLLAAPAAVTFTVDTTDDRLDDDTGDGVCHTSVNTCALRAAIMQANHLTGPGVTTIILPAGTYTLTRPIGPGPDENSGDLDLTAALSANQTISLLGAGAGSTIIDANQIDRVMHIALGRTATISGVTLRNGYISDSFVGGGLYNDGSLTVTNVMVSGNRAQFGGGIYNGADGSLTVVNSTISDNSASGDGGGLFNYLTLTIINSTISNNHADDDGGGIFNTNGQGNVYNTTIVFNGANADADANGQGGGVYNDSGATLSLRNSLVAGNNVSAAPVEDDCNGSLGLYGVNLMGLTAEGTNYCTISGTGVWTYLNSTAYLGQLQDNGGPTWTHALLPGSNAIDGDNIFSPMNCIAPGSDPLLTDQRGFARPVGSSCDIGAFEYSPLSYLYLPLVVR